MKIGLPEQILIQVIIYLAIYLTDSYAGVLICLVMIPIFLFTLIISTIAEWIEPSKISKSYFRFMITGIVIPILVLIAVATLDSSALAWMSK